MTATIRAVDLSSYNIPSLAAMNDWIAEGAQLAIIHAYHGGEAPGLDVTTRAWVDVAQQAKIWPLPYVWLFRSYGADRAVIEALEVFWSVGERPGLVFLDCETYQSVGVSDLGPTAEQILVACEAARALKVEPIIYSNKPWLDQIEGNHLILDGIPAWIANYDDRQDLNVPAPAWVRVLGHQYTSKPVDWSVFDLDALTALQTPPDPCAALRNGLRAELARKRLNRKKLAALL